MKESDPGHSKCPESPGRPQGGLNPRYRRERANDTPLIELIEKALFSGSADLERTSLRLLLKKVAERAIDADTAADLLERVIRRADACGHDALSRPHTYR